MTPSPLAGLVDPTWFDWLSLWVSVGAAAIPVAITIWLWRMDRAALIAASDRARRGQIYERASALFGGMLDMMQRNELGLLTSRKHALIAAVSSLAEPQDAAAIEWIHATSAATMDALGIDGFFEVPAPRPIPAADDLAVRALTPIENWMRDPKSVDFKALEQSDEWRQVFIDWRRSDNE